MLAIETIQEVQRLLAIGELSHRSIARQVGCSRGVVDQIASGRRGAYGRGEPEAPPPPLRRCPGCGGQARGACVYCRAVEYRRRKGRAA
ncbi:hypothetical protein [Pirellulimonas nuda]|uniref:hypothetical protein n=1 Tax=Pirellulimonas nuda TaxID=2528009 RepID=UPI0011A4BCEE|nr:hypothetical protein [Pirellulimonas nuda]